MDFDKLSKVYSQHEYDLPRLINVICENICESFSKNVTDYMFDKALDFCLSFPEWIDYERHYDGSLYIIVDSYMIYLSDIDKLLRPTKRRDRKYIYEVIVNKQDLLRRMGYK